MLLFEWQSMASLPVKPDELDPRWDKGSPAGGIWSGGGERPQLTLCLDVLLGLQTEQTGFGTFYAQRTIHFLHCLYSSISFLHALHWHPFSKEKLPDASFCLSKLVWAIIFL